jgi:hypothetical protein
MSVSTRACQWTAALLGSAVLTFGAGTANATGVFLAQCDTCLTLADFETSAAQAAYARGTLGGGVAGLGTYVIVNRVNPKSAIVMVSGRRVQSCDSHGECRYRLVITGVRAINETGGSALAEDLQKTDETLFANTRATPLPPVNLSETYASSFIGSIDEEVGPGIPLAIAAKGINPVFLPVGTVVMVVFPDGTKATFIKVTAMGSDQWRWTGKAWNAQGRPINRNGSPKAGGVAGASGGGQVNTNTFAASFALVASQSCQMSTSIHDPAGGVTYTVWHLIPC